MPKIQAAGAEAGPAVGPVRAATGAIATTIACVLPVFLVGGLAVQMRDELGFTPFGLGLAVSVYFGVSALASVPTGALVERYGAARTARAGILLAAASLLAVAVLARSFAVLVALLAISAGANALGQLASNTALARHVPAGRQGLSFGVKQAAIPVSTLLAGASVPLVALTAGWRWAFAAAAGAALATLWLVPPEERTGGRRASSRSATRVTGPLVVLGAAATLAAGSANALGTFLVDSSAAQGMAPGLAGLTLTFGSVVCIAGRVLGGWLADLRGGRHVPAIAAMLAIGAAGLGLLAFGSAPALVAGVALGFGLGWAWPGVLNFAVVQLHPAAPAAATSITQTGVYAGGAVGPIALGTVAAHSGYPAMWLGSAASMLAAAGFMLLGGRMVASGDRMGTGPGHTVGRRERVVRPAG
jgi:predicted MFS family arabinose efflux permease